MPYDLTNPYTLVLGGVAAFSFVLAGVTARYRSGRTGITLAAFLAFAGLWTLGDAVRLAAPNEAHILFWNKVAYVGIAGIATAYILFMAAFANREQWFRRRRVGGLVAMSIIALALVLTNQWHHLWRAGETITPGSSPPVLDEHRGPAWFVWAVYAYTIVSLGIYFVLQEFLQSHHSRTYRTQAGLILGASFLAHGSNISFTTLDLVAFDPTPATFGVMGLAFAVAIFRYQLLDMTPIARDVVLSELDSGVLVLNGEQIVDANQHARQILDLDADVPGTTLSAALADYPSVHERFRAVTDTTETVTVETDQGTRHYEVDVSPIRDPLDDHLGRVVVFSDVTERIRRERRLEERTTELQHKNDRLDEFATVVSHDLRNPLEVARGYLDPARETGRDEYFDEIEAGLERMENMIAEVLALARQGETIESVEDVHVPSVAESAWEIVDTDGTTLEVPRGQDWTVRGDENRLQSLFENLFRNAVEHADATRVTVGDLPDGFFVADDGPGIPESDREKVFDQGYSTSDDGTGLGLAIVRGIVDAHGWSIEIGDSDAGGARFDVVTETTFDADKDPANDPIGEKA